MRTHLFVVDCAVKLHSSGSSGDGGCDDGGSYGVSDDASRAPAAAAASMDRDNMQVAVEGEERKAFVCLREVAAAAAAQAAFMPTSVREAEASALLLIVKRACALEQRR